MESEALKTNLQPGDFILIQTPGNVYSSIRKTMDICYDHMAVLLDKDTVFHISPPVIRKISSNVFLMKKRNPLIIRPNLTAMQKEEFIKSLEPCLGSKYDYSALFSLIGKKIYHEFSKRVDLNDDPFKIFQKTLSLYQSKEKNEAPNICTDLLFSKLKKISPEFSELIKMNENSLNYSYLGSFSPDDLLMLSEKNPVALQAFHCYPTVPANVINNLQNLDFKESDLEISENFGNGVSLKKLMNIIDKVLFISSLKQNFKQYKTGLSRISKKTIKSKREFFQTFKLVYLLYSMRKLLQVSEKKTLTFSQTKDLLKQGLEIYLLLQDTDLSEFLKRPFLKSKL